jgi:hypothetical protein
MQRIVIDKTVQNEISPVGDSGDSSIMSPSVRHFLGQVTNESDTEGEAQASQNPGLDEDQARLLQASSCNSSSQMSEGNEIELHDDDYMVCGCLTLCFLLRNKLWGAVLISGLKDIQWKSDPYANLQMPDDKKVFVRNLVMGFSSETTRSPHHNGGHGAGDDESDEEFDDFIEGKGRGLIFLLHGEPGLGKTLTAGKLYQGHPVYFPCPKLRMLINFALNQRASPRARGARYTTCQQAT